MEKKLLVKYTDVQICREELTILKHINFELYSGEFVYFIGRVGSGKSSLLKTMYADLPIYEGEAIVLDFDVRHLKNKEIPNLRRKLGIVFQDFQLLTDRSVYENLAFVLRATGWKDREEIDTRVSEVLDQVGMRKKSYKMPHELSGGEQQRIVIARALLNSPKIILADEPTGNLDPTTSLGIMEVLDAINRTGTTVVMATHNEEIVNSMRKRVVELHTGKIVRDEQQGSYDSALYFPDAEVESKSHQALNGGDADAKYRAPSGLVVSDASDGTVDVEGATRAETAANAVDAVAAAIHSGNGDAGIARLANSVHSGRTGRYGEAFAPVETTLTWGKGLKIEELAEQEQADSSALSQSESNADATIVSSETSVEAGNADENEQLAEPTVPAPPAPPMPPVPPAPPAPPAVPAATDDDEANCAEQSAEQHETSENKEND